MMKKIVIGVLAAVILLTGIYLIGTGLMRRTDVAVSKFAMSENGESMTVTAVVAGSMGYIRDVSVEQKEGVLYLTFYSAFGGLNSSFGARNEFTLTLDDHITEISVYRGSGKYETVLQKNPEGGRWERMD